MNKKKIVTVLIVIATVILAGVAVFTAIRLYQLREEAVAPTAPTSEPAAAEPEDTGGGGGIDPPPGRSSCTISFTVAAEEITYTCDSACTTDAQCQEADEDYICYTISDTCRHQDYPEQEDCLPAATESPTATATPTDAPTDAPTATATSTAEPELPDAGISYPTIISGVMGILLILISLALAL